MDMSKRLFAGWNDGEMRGPEQVANHSEGLMEDDAVQCGIGGLIAEA